LFGWSRPYERTILAIYGRIRAVRGQQLSHEDDRCSGRLISELLRSSHTPRTRACSGVRRTRVERLDPLGPLRA
jgi:hypothetical protein